MCLVDQALAKECVTLLVREIDAACAPAAALPGHSPAAGEAAAGSSPAVASNALLVLGDLCVRYTALVERHLPAIAKCLQVFLRTLVRAYALVCVKGGGALEVLSDGRRLLNFPTRARFPARSQKLLCIPFARLRR